MENRLSSLLCHGTILPRLHAVSKKQILLDLSDVIARHHNLNQRDIFDSILVREKLGSTGIGDNVAIPHARIDEIKGPIGAFATLVTPIDFEAVDDRPCDLIFMLLAPEKSGADHLRALARIARFFRHAQSRELLRNAYSADDILSVLSDLEQTYAA